MCGNNPWVCIAAMWVVYCVAVTLAVFIVGIASNYANKKIPYLYKKHYDLGRMYMGIMLYHCTRPINQGIFANPFYKGMYDRLCETKTVDPLLILTLDTCVKQIGEELEYSGTNIYEDLPNLVKKLKHELNRLKENTGE